MNKKYIFITTLLLLSTLCQAAHSTQSASLEPLDGIAAVVNKDVITTAELNQKVEQIEKQLKNNHTPLPDEKLLKGQVLEHMIDEKLELQTAQRAGIEIDDDTLNHTIASIAEQNKISVPALQQKLKSDGIDYRQYRDNIRDELTIERLLQREVGSRISISKQEVDKYLHSAAYEQANITEYRVGDILIALPEVPSSDELQHANKTADKLLKQLKAGKDFESVAIAQSNGQEALQGGDLGWRRIEEIPSVFTEKLKTMEKNNVEGPIRAANGYHIIKLIDIRGETGKHAVTETKARHILLKTNALNDDKETEEHLKKIRENIVKGENFEEAAKKYSQDTGSAVRGGDLGWAPPGMLVPSFEDAMNKLKEGDVSQPVKTHFGWHLIFVEGRRQRDNTEEYQRDKIRKLIFERQYREKTEAWIRQMRDVSFIKILLPATPEKTTA